MATVDVEQVERRRPGRPRGTGRGRLRGRLRGRISVPASAAFLSWLRGAADRRGVQVTDVVREALRRLAEADGDAAPPTR